MAAGRADYTPIFLSEIEALFTSGAHPLDVVLLQVSPLEVEERSIDRSELYVAEEAFFTGTAVELAPIVRIDHRPVGEGVVGPVAGQLRRLYGLAAHGRLEEYGHWLRRVYGSASEKQPSLTGKSSPLR